MVRATCFVNSCDLVGRRWLHVLPPSPLEPLVQELRLPRLPLELVRRIWELANSWPVRRAPIHDEAGAHEVAQGERGVSHAGPEDLTV